MLTLATTITQDRSTPIQSSSCRAFLEPQHIFIYAESSGGFPNEISRGECKERESVCVCARKRRFRPCKRGSNTHTRKRTRCLR